MTDQNTQELNLSPAARKALRAAQPTLWFARLGVRAEAELYRLGLTVPSPYGPCFTRKGYEVATVLVAEEVS